MSVLYTYISCCKAERKIGLHGYFAEVADGSTLDNDNCPDYI